MKVKEVADLVGVSVRTLHHYDEIDLLKPDTITVSGYRLYSVNNLETLQQILFFKELGFNLKQIKEIINNPKFDRIKALEVQRKMLLEKKERIEKMINTIEKTIKHSKGVIKMSIKEKFEGFDFNHNPYESEARKLWGDKAVDESNENIEKLSNFEKKEYSEKFGKVISHLANIRTLDPKSSEAQSAIHEWYKLISLFGKYSMEAFKNLGKMYIEDERFTKNLDQYGEGLANFMAEAITYYVDNNK